MDITHPLAVALVSGGLDSTLAAAIVKQQGITVVGVNFQGGYCPGPWEGLSRAQVAAGQIGIELVTLPIDADFIAVVKKPKHGRGKNMNPCIDCHVMMIRKAWEYGRTRGAEFVVTGEVLGQRPMSQNRRSLDLVAAESGIGDRLVRPLSARLLEPTWPERTGLLDRNRLYDIQGRTRDRQAALAREFGINEYPQPAGGCLLTEKVYSARLREAFAHGEDSVTHIELLRIGRHFRLESGSRVVLGRNKQENAELLSRLPDSAALIDATSLPGPLALLVPDSGEADRLLAARLCVAYSDKRDAGAQPVRIASMRQSETGLAADRIVTVTALGPDDIRRLAISG